MKREGPLAGLRCDPGPHRGPIKGAATARPRRSHVAGAERERTRWHPKDGELCPGRTRPEETLVEVRSDSDVQIDRPIRV
ncbi:hypothetical protein HPB50_008906 [Hyalomma asiaticum]|uniref:Uncharacterized protein n=1 Tax=Hyalomma asiaticum TaxID=266040 RepID=A0ACB7SDC5_HYAAI|nr:hypothetical protein HPB50_028980 [Hyalomma asiaticum]KAH6932710.1 hypothetical protein HPB50_008906 [Hyalomma asiaticum]